MITKSVRRVVGPALEPDTPESVAATENLRDSIRLAQLGCVCTKPCEIMPWTITSIDGVGGHVQSLQVGAFSPNPNCPALQEVGEAINSK